MENCKYIGNFNIPNKGCIYLKVMECKTNKIVYEDHEELADSIKSNDTCRKLLYRIKLDLPQYYPDIIMINNSYKENI